MPNFIHCPNDVEQAQLVQGTALLQLCPAYTVKEDSC